MSFQRAILILFAVISIICIFHSDYFVFDELHHLRDVKLYENNTFNAETIRKHSTAAGIGANLLFAIWAKLLHTSNLYVYRLLSLLSICLVYVLLQKMVFKDTNERKSIQFGFLFLICSPYALLCSTSVMTEFPSILFIIPSTIYLLSQEDIAQKPLRLKFLVTCLLIGYGIISRLYFVAIIPAISLIFYLPALKNFSVVLNYKLFIYCTLMVLPLGAMVYIWGGASSPNLYKTTGIIDVTINPLRSIIALSYIGFYVSFFYLANFKNIGFDKWLFLLSFGFAAMVSFYEINVWNYPDRNVSSGMIYSFISLFKNKIVNTSISFTLICYALYWGLYFLKNMYFTVIKSLNDHLNTFSFLFTVFFILQQTFIGGDIPFYERYLICLYFYIGYLIYRNVESSSSVLYIYISITFSLSLARALIYHGFF